MSYRTSYGRSVKRLDKSLLSNSVVESEDEESESAESAVSPSPQRSKNRWRRSASASTSGRHKHQRCFLCLESVVDLVDHLQSHRESLKIYACQRCLRGFTNGQLYGSHQCHRSKGRKGQLRTPIDQLEHLTHLIMLKCCGKVVCNVEQDSLLELNKLIRSTEDFDGCSLLRLVNIFSSEELSTKWPLTVTYISQSRAFPTSCYLCPTEKFKAIGDLFAHLNDVKHQGDLRCPQCGVDQSSAMAYHDHLLNRYCEAEGFAEQQNLADFVKSTGVEESPSADQKEKKNSRERRKKVIHNPRIQCDLCAKKFTQNQWNRHDCAVSYTRRLLVDKQIVKCPAVTVTTSLVECCRDGCVEVPLAMWAWMSRNVKLSLSTDGGIQLCHCHLKDQADRNVSPFKYDKIEVERHMLDCSDAKSVDIVNEATTDLLDVEESEAKETLASTPVPATEESLQNEAVASRGSTGVTDEDFDISPEPEPIVETSDQAAAEPIDNGRISSPCDNSPDANMTPSPICSSAPDVQDGIVGEDVAVAKEESVADDNSPENREESAETAVDAAAVEEVAITADNFFDQLKFDEKPSVDSLMELERPAEDKVVEEETLTNGDLEEKRPDLLSDSGRTTAQLKPDGSTTAEMPQSQGEAAESLLAKEETAETAPVTPRRKLPIKICEVFSLAPPEIPPPTEVSLEPNVESVERNSELSAVPQLSPSTVSAASVIPSLAGLEPTCSFAQAPLPGIDPGSYCMTVLPQNLIPERLATDFAAVISPADDRLGPHYFVSGSAAKTALLEKESRAQETASPHPIVIAESLPKPIVSVAHSQFPEVVTSTTCTVCRSEHASREALAVHMKEKHILLCPNCTVCFVNESCQMAHADICVKSGEDLRGMVFWCPQCPLFFPQTRQYYVHLIESHPDKVSFANRTGVVIPECIVARSAADSSDAGRRIPLCPSPVIEAIVATSSSLPSGNSTQEEGEVDLASEPPSPKRRRLSESNLRPTVISSPSTPHFSQSDAHFLDRFEQRISEQRVAPSVNASRTDSLDIATTSHSQTPTVEEVTEVLQEEDTPAECFTSIVTTPAVVPVITEMDDDECAIVEELPKSEASRFNNSPCDSSGTTDSSVVNKRAVHGCPTCKKLFMTKLALADHMGTHQHDAGNTSEEVLPIPPNATVYVCRFCSIAYSSRETFQQHFNRHNDFYSCPMCSCIAATRDLITAHTNAHTTGLAFGCSVCFKAMRSEFALHMHLTVTHGFVMIWICKSCCFAHQDISMVVGHIGVAHNEQLQAPNRDRNSQIRQLLGVCAHRKLHYQPAPGETFVPQHQLPVENRIVVGECAHRTFNCYTETMIVCSKCGTLLPAGKFLLEDENLRKQGQVQLQLMDEISEREISTLLPGTAKKAPPPLTVRPAGPPPLIQTVRPPPPNVQPFSNAPAIARLLPPRMAMRDPIPASARTPQIVRALNAPVGRQVMEVRATVNDVVNDVVQRSSQYLDETVNAVVNRVKQTAASVDPIPARMQVALTGSKFPVRPSNSFKPPRHIAPAPPGHHQQMNSMASSKRQTASVCELCGETMNSPAALKVHVLRHYPKSKFLCLDCGFYCEASDGLSVHLIDSHIEKLKYNLECRKCHSFFPNPPSFISHSHSDMHRCQRCRLSFITPAAYQKHVAAHSRGGAHSCLFCGNCYSVKRALELHEVSEHCTVRWSMCRECGLCFNKLVQLREHFQTKHILPAKSHSRDHPWCKICQRHFLCIDEHMLSVHEVIALKLRDPTTFDPSRDELIGSAAAAPSVSSNLRSAVNRFAQGGPPGHSGVTPPQQARQTSVITSKTNLTPIAAGRSVVQPARHPPLKQANSEDITWLTQFDSALELLWICQHCKEVFVEELLRNHFGAHQYPGFWLLKVRPEDGNSANRLAVCSICDFECFNRQQMFDHLQLKHNHLGCFPCTDPDCQESFVYRDDRNYHLTVNHEGKHRFIPTALARTGEVCLFCALDYKSPTELVKHVVSMHVVGRGNLIADGSGHVWMCTACGICLNDTTDLEIHISNHRLESALRISNGYMEGRSYIRIEVECQMGKSLEIFCPICRANISRGTNAVRHFMEKHVGEERILIERLHAPPPYNPMKLHDRRSCRWCSFLNN